MKSGAMSFLTNLTRRYPGRTLRLGWVWVVQAIKHLKAKLDLTFELLAIRVSEPKDFESDVSFSQLVPIFRKISNENFFCDFLVIYKSKDKTNGTIVFLVEFYIRICLLTCPKMLNKFEIVKQMIIFWFSTVEIKHYFYI